MSTPTSGKPLAVEVAIPIRTYDIDYAGIVSNIVYVRWLEDLRLHSLAIHFPLEAQIAQGIGPILIKTEIEYKRPLRLFDQPLGRMWIAEYGKTSFSLAAEFVVGETLHAVARQTGCFVNQTLRPIPIPPELLSKFQAAEAAL